MGTYLCKMKGCVGSGSFSMEPGEEAWHMQKFGHLPTNCPACRAWKKAQTDVEITCSSCDFTFRITARQIIGWHTHNGIWEQPTLCKMCEEDPNRASRKRNQKTAISEASAFLAKKASNPLDDSLKALAKKMFGKYDKRQLNDLRQLVIDLHRAQMTRAVILAQWGTKPIDVVTDVQFYANLHDPKHGNRLSHIKDKHYRRGHLAGLNARSIDEALQKLGEIASSNSDDIYDFRDSKTNYIVKYQEKTGIVVLIDDSRRFINTEHIVTAYTPSNALTKIGGSKWIPDF